MDTNSFRGSSRAVVELLPGLPIFVFIHVHWWLKKTKTPPPGWQWGPVNFRESPEPDCRAAQQQRVRKQQIQVAIHGAKIIGMAKPVNFNFALALTKTAL
jgi:hypothetical protein